MGLSFQMLDLVVVFFSDLRGISDASWLISGWVWSHRGPLSRNGRCNNGDRKLMKLIRSCDSSTLKCRQEEKSLAMMEWETVHTQLVYALSLSNPIWVAHIFDPMFWYFMFWYFVEYTGTREMKNFGWLRIEMWWWRDKKSSNPYKDKT